MSDNDYRKKFVALTKQGEKLWEEYLSLKSRPVYSNLADTRVDILKYERLQKQIDENLKELQFVYYQIKAKEMM